VTSPEKRAVSNSKDDIELLTDNSDVCGNSGVVLYEDAPISDNVSHLGVKGQRAMKFTIRREEAEPVEQTTEFQLEAVSEGVALYAMQKGSPQRYRILTVRPNKPILRHPGVPEFLGLPVNSAGYVLID
jgi:hypothetical protein